MPEENKKESFNQSLEFNGEVWYEIKKGKEKHIIDLDNRTCICKSWQLTTIPCIHIACTMFKAGVRPKDKVDDCYNKNIYLQDYQYSL